MILLTMVIRLHIAQWTLQVAMKYSEYIRFLFKIVVLKHLTFIEYLNTHRLSKLILLTVYSWKDLYN